MKRITLICCILMACLISQPAYSYWIWTPKTGKWVNPKTEVKPTPKDQLDFAKGLYEAKEYDEARREFQKLIKKFPKAAEAAESQFYLGKIEDAKGSLYEAFQSYQKVVDKYPFSERIAEVIEREYAIAEDFMTGKAKRKALGMNLPVDNPAAEIFTKVVANSQYGPLAAKAQYKLGMVLKSQEQYYEAEDAFSKVVANYPDSEWAAAAKYQIAATRAMLSKGPDYDQAATKEAREKFQEFVLSHPDAALSEEAEKNIKNLNEKEAESNFNIGRFYEKQKDYKAAEIYYHEIIDRNPESGWAAKALERLKIVEKKWK